MHINHRRKNPPPVNKFRTHCRHGYPFGLYSYKAMQRESWQERRSQVRDLLARGLYDDIPSFYRRDILWRYW